EFPSTVPVNPGDQSRYVQMSLVGTDILLYVTATGYVETTNAAKIALVRVSASGAVQSAQKLYLPLLGTNQSAFASFPIVTPTGEILIYASDYTFQGFSYTPYTIHAKLDAN